MACIDRRWLCFIPEQVLPLGNSTPDLHQCAEVLVGIYKSFLRTWTIWQDPDSSSVMYARNYKRQLDGEVANRNLIDEETCLSKDQSAIANNLRRMWTAAQIVASPYGQWFSLTKPPDPATGDAEQEKFEVMGSGGRFPGTCWA